MRKPDRMTPAATTNNAQYDAVKPPRAVLSALITRVLCVVLSVLAFRLDAQTQPSTATMTIHVQVPSNTPASDTIWVFGGQLFNIFTPRVPMSRVPGISNTWQATISAPTGTIFRYYFARNNDYSKLESYVPFWPNGYSIGPGLYQQQAPLRELLVTNGATIAETVAAWDDTPPFSDSTGTITGTITDKMGNPLTGLWISAGPHQTFSDTRGNYQMQGVPAGPCTITVRSENGEYAAVNVSVTIAANGATTQNIALVAQPIVNVTFNVTVPATTPALAVPHLFGDMYRLGMVEIATAFSAETTRYIEMTPGAGLKWSFTTQLGSGTCVNYLYTLGDNILNFENQQGQGVIVTRALCVNGPTTVNDKVAAWSSPTQVAVTLTATSPTGAEDTLYVTADSGFGSAPVKMWPTGPGTATYTFYVNPNTTLKYSYLRNGDPDTGPEIIGTDSNPPASRSLAVGTNAVSSNDTIMAWRNQMLEPALTTVTSGMTGPAVPHAEPFQTGIELVDYWRTSWLPLVAPTISRIKSINAQWVMIVPNYTPTIVDPPQFELVLDDFPPQDLIAHIRTAKAAGLHVALKAQMYPNSFSLAQGNAWVDAFFQQVQSFSMYYAAIASQEGVEMLVLESQYLESAASGIDTDPALRTYVNAKFKAVVAAIRASGYTGKLTTDTLVNYPELDWYGGLDYLGDEWWYQKVATSDSDTVQSMYNQTIAALTSQYLPAVNRFNKPVVFVGVEYYSAHTSALQTYAFGPQIAESLPADPSVLGDYDEQGRVYQAVLLAFAATPWVQGCYSFGYEYYNLDSKGYSIRAKTAEQIVSQVYQEINATPSAASPSITAVVNGADFKSETLSPGAWISILGQNLGQFETASSADTLTLGGASVSVCGIIAVLNYNSGPVTTNGSTGWQINALVPDGVAGQTSCSVVVTVGAQASPPVNVAIASGVLELFQFTTSAGTLPIITHADYSLIGPASAGLVPAKPNETVIAWATGDCSTPTMTVGGASAIVAFSGRVEPGLCQINFLVPNAPAGNNQLTISTSPNTYNLWISQ
jgi:uncharacterized protein (TIGR03437 family)